VCRRRRRCGHFRHYRRIERHRRKALDFERWLRRSRRFAHDGPDRRDTRVPHHELTRRRWGDARLGEQDVIRRGWRDAGRGHHDFFFDDGRQALERQAHRRGFEGEIELINQEIVVIDQGRLCVVGSGRRGRIFEVRELARTLEQLFERDRFVDVVFGAAAQAPVLLECLVRRIPAQDQHRHRSENAVALQLVADREAVATWQLHGQQNQVGLVGRRGLEALGRILHHRNLAADLREPLP
jgi:hypothetical protein